MRTFTATNTQISITSFSPNATLPAAFWSTSVLADGPIDGNTSLELNATPARWIVFPGGYLADEMDLANSTIHGAKGETYAATTTTPQFVAWCRSVACHAIFEVPGEINSSSTAAYYVRYVEQTLHFHPDYWEIGNEPAIWKKYNLPWSEWASSSTTPPTTTQYAYLVHLYIAAMRSVDPTISIIGFPGSGTGSYMESDWLSATVSENGPNLSGVGIHVYPGGLGPTDPSQATLTTFLNSLSSHASLPVRVPTDLAAIRSACSKCGPIPLLVTEYGSDNPGDLMDAFIGGFPQVVYIGAELSQAADLGIGNMAYWSFQHDSPSAWFPVGALSLPIYQFYAEIASRLGPGILPVNLTSTVRGIYALATVGNSSSSPIDLLVDDANATLPIAFSTAATGLDTSGPIETWSWNNSSTEPVVRYWPTGLPSTWTEPAASIVLFEQPRTPTFPLTVTGTGLAPSTRWFLQVGNVTESTNSTHLTFFLPNGQYSQIYPATTYPAPGERVSLSLPPTVTIDNAPVNETGTFGTEYLVTTSANPTSGGTTSPTSVWVPAGQSIRIVATASAGYQFQDWQGSGAGNYSGPSNPASAAPAGPVTEVAQFGPTLPAEYLVTFQASGLPSGTRWWANVSGGASESSTGATISVSLTNGSYHYSIGSSDTTYSAPGGAFTVSGTPVSQPVVFSRVTYSANFTETGLPAGTPWWVNITSGPSQSATGTTITLALSNGTYSYAVATSDKSYSAAGGSFAIRGASVSTTVEFSSVTYSVTLNATGLPSGTEWWVNATGDISQNSTDSTIALALPNGTYAYTASSADPRYSAPAGTFTVQGTALAESIPFSLVTYPVTFSEGGLPTGTEWWANVTGSAPVNSTGSAISMPLPNGTYVFTTSSADPRYSAPGGTFSVRGAPVSEPVPFSTVSYPVTFTETGLPAGGTWWVNLSGEPSQDSMGIEISLPLPNGTYAYSIGVAPNRYAAPGGTLTVDGAGVSEPVDISPVTFSVTFTETGLSTGSEWWVNLTEGPSFSATGSTVSFSEMNGSYAYSVRSAGWQSTPASGTVTVLGSNVSVSVLFSRSGFFVNFTESGLPPATLWSVMLGGVTQSSSGTTIGFFGLPGTYAFSIDAVGVWVPSPDAGNVTVTNSARVVEISFALTYEMTFERPDGMTAGTNWSVTLTPIPLGAELVHVGGTEVRSSTGATIDFQEPNGTYAYSARVAGDPDYHASGQSVVSGSGTTVALPPIAATGGAGTGGGVPVDLGLGIALAAVGLLATVTLVLFHRRRRPPRSGGP